MLFFKEKSVTKMRDVLSVVVCTRGKDEENNLVNHIKETCECDCHVFLLINPEGVGLTKVYGDFLTTRKDEIPGNVIAFVHDDVQFLRKGWGKELLRLFKNNKDYGIIGVAGSAQFDDKGAWWNYEKKYGQVLHRSEGKSWLSAFSPLLNKDLQEVCVIDGLFMGVHKKRITQGFDENIKGFDFYDIDFCLANYVDKKTKIGVTTNIRLAHNSVGKLKPSWYENRNYINEKYKDVFPIVVN